MQEIYLWLLQLNFAGTINSVVADGHGGKPEEEELTNADFLGQAELL